MSINFLSGGLPDYEDTHDFAIRQKLEQRIAELEAKNAALSRVATEGLRNQERITDEMKARADHQNP